jgi:hypothetical protein
MHQLPRVVIGFQACAAWIIQIQAGAHTLTAADPLPNDLREALANIHGSAKRTH